MFPRSCMMLYIERGKVQIDIIGNNYVKLLLKCMCLNLHSHFVITIYCYEHQV